MKVRPLHGLAERLQETTTLSPAQLFVLRELERSSGEWVSFETLQKALTSRNLLTPHAAAARTGLQKILKSLDKKLENVGRLERQRGKGIRLPRTQNEVDAMSLTAIRQEVQDLRRQVAALAQLVKLTLKVQIDTSNVAVNKRIEEILSDFKQRTQDSTQERLRNQRMLLAEGWAMPDPDRDPISELQDLAFMTDEEEPAATTPSRPSSSSKPATYTPASPRKRPGPSEPHGGDR